MAGLLKALEDRDVDAFLRFFSQRKPWEFLGTIGDPSEVDEVKFDNLAKDLRSKAGWYETLFDGGNFDCFRDHVSQTGGRKWTRVSEWKYVPPDGYGGGKVFVSWRREGDRWVVDKIGEPGS